MNKFILVLVTIVVTAVIVAGATWFYIKSSEVEILNSKTYTNNEYGFELTFPDSWKGYIVERKDWEGVRIDRPAIEGGPDYSGPLLVFKNPQTTAQQQYQDIPVMVFTPEVWALVKGPDATVAVSAAPIAPAKIGENSKYIFATPPRWYGFTDAVGFQEAVEIVKTFTGLNNF